MKPLKRLTLIVTALLLTWGTARFCHSRTRGFKLSKIAENCPSRSLPDSLAPLPDAFPDRFKFLGRGLQSFAFVSEDNQVVLKLFNNRYQRKIFWFSHLPFCIEKKTYNTQKLKKIAASYELAASELHDETGLLYLHLSPTAHLKKTVTLIDHLGIEHPINLDEFGFVLQKKVSMVYPYLSHLLQKGDLTQAQASIRSLVNLLVSRCKKGIHDNDPLIRTNCGFIDGQAYLIDLGPFSKNASIQDPHYYLREVERITGSLRRWLEHNHPEHLGALQAALQTPPTDETTSR